MQIDIKTETIVALSEGKRHFPRRPSYTALKRWNRIGLRGRNGQRFFLDIVKIGPELCTSQEAFERFCAQLTEDDFIADEELGEDDD